MNSYVTWIEMYNIRSNINGSLILSAKSMYNMCMSKCQSENTVKGNLAKLNYLMA